MNHGPALNLPPVSHGLTQMANFRFTVTGSLNNTIALMTQFCFVLIHLPSIYSLQPWSTVPLLTNVLEQRLELGCFFWMLTDDVRPLALIVFYVIKLTRF